MDAEDAPLVVNASVTLKWLVEEPGSEAALALRGRDLAAPVLLRIEVANVLRTLVVRGATDQTQAVGLLRLLQSEPLILAETDDALQARALELALDLGRPVYDCIHLATAERMGRILVTADERFLKALRPTRHAARAVSLEGAGRPSRSKPQSEEPRGGAPSVRLIQSTAWRSRFLRRRVDRLPGGAKAAPSAECATSDRLERASSAIGSACSAPATTLTFVAGSV